MQRIRRVGASSLSKRAQDYAQGARPWQRELSLALGSEVASLLALAERDGDFVNYSSPHEGQAQEVGAGEGLGGAMASQLGAGRTALLTFLEGSSPLVDASLEGKRRDLAELIRHCQHVALINGTWPCLVLAETQEEALAAARLAAAPPKKLSPWWLLLPLLLLALLWWWLLYPWPLCTAGTDHKTQATVPESQSQAPAVPLRGDGKDEAALLDLDTMEELLRQERERLRADAAEAQLDAEAKALEEEARRRTEAEARERERRDAEARERARLEAERIRAEQAEAARRQAEQKKERQEVASTGKALPKCETIKKERKVPRMVIGFDGSLSMLNPIAGMRNRLDAAQRATVALAKRIDPNVPIGLVEINGCPFAKRRGFFNGSQRGSLISAVHGINPHRYDGGTPLKDALVQMADLVDGRSAEAVGVLISDGVDSGCSRISKDICELAQGIHAAKPKFRIHTILIGDEADSARCVSQITGGRIFKPQNAAEIESVLRKAGADYERVCK
ncbi:MAG: hypothetical protein K6A65_02725 [Succinivibrionaceae bacterium]|nr:hypothetical protein [Succinivibrionaceae bacterium]